MAAEDEREPGDDGGDGRSDGVSVDPRDALPPDERSLLEAFDRLRPQGTIGWNFDDAIRRLNEPDDIPGRPAGWGGLPTDLWERGRSTKASERVLGDVVKIVAQDLTEYTDRAVEEGYRMSDQAVTELRLTVLDAVRFLSARVERLEASIDPLGMQAGELDLPTFDAAIWTESAIGWSTGHGGLPALIGELGDDALLAAVVRSGARVEGVDPRGAVVWPAATALVAGNGRVDIVLADVVDHLASLPDASRSCAILTGCVDRADLVGKVRLVDAARRVVAPGGTVALLVTDQVAWDASLAPVVRDLLPGRPLHPEAWLTVLAQRGLDHPTWLHPESGNVHAVTAEVRR